MPHIPRHEIWQFRECFDWFDRDKDGRINPIELPAALRAMGQYWTFYELTELMKEFPANREVDFDSYLKIAERKYGVGADIQKLTQAFETLDRVKSGKVFADDVRHLLCSVGEKLTPAEFEELCAISGFPYKGKSQTFDKEQFLRLFGGYQQKDVK